MNKRVTLKLSNGTLQTGFPVTLQMGNEGAVPTVLLTASLPAAPSLIACYQRWQSTYRRQAQLCSARIEANQVGFATNVSFITDTSDLAAQLKTAFNQWLRTEAFRPAKEKLLERLRPDQTIQLIVQTQDSTVQRQPRHQ